MYIQQIIAFYSLYTYNFVNYTSVWLGKSKGTTNSFESVPVLSSFSLFHTAYSLPFLPHKLSFSYRNRNIERIKYYLLEPCFNFILSSYIISAPFIRKVNESSISTVLSFFFFLVFSRAAPMAYGSSQVKDLNGTIAAILHHSHSNAGSDPHLQPTPQLTATLDP